MTTTHKEALKALIHEMEYVLSCINVDKVPFDGDDFHEALRLGKEALAQPKQAPDWYHVIDVHGCNRFYHKTEDCPYELKTPFYTTPPTQQDCSQRTAAEGEDSKAWVGLTEEEVIDLWPDLIMHRHTYQFWQNLEAKLKEKNT